MPVGVDVIDWSLRKGSTGDDRYSLDPDGDCRWHAGLNVYSTNPTLAEINAGDGMNQIIAAVNFRMRLYTDAINNGSTWTNLPYVVPGTRGISQSMVAGLMSQIDTIRAPENMSAFPWTITFLGAPKIQHLFELRKALATDCFYYPWPRSLSNGRHSGFVQYEKSTYPAATGGTFTGAANATRLNAGQQNRSGTFLYLQLRQIVDLHIPDYLPVINSIGAYFGFTRVQSVTGDPAKVCTLEAYLSNTYVSGTPVAADWARLDTYLNSLSILTSQQNAQVLPAGGGSLALNPNTNHSVYFCTNEERSNTDQNSGVPYYSIARNYSQTVGTEALLLYN